MRIITCTMNELEDASQFAYERNVHETYRCRPFLLKESFEKIKNTYNDYITKEYHDVLLQYEGNDLVGVTGIYWLPEDYYLSITRGIFAKDDYSRVSQEFLCYLKSKYAGYKLYINTAKEHLDALNFYIHNGFEMLEDAVLYNLYDFTQSSFGEHVESINDDNKAIIFNELETNMTEDTYWNIERLSNHLNKFIVLGYIGTDIKGAVYAQIYKDNSVEVMGITGETPIKEILLNALAYTCKENHTYKLILYTEESDEINLANKLGYEYHDSNVCFLKNLK